MRVLEWMDTVARVSTATKVQLNRRGRHRRSLFLVVILLGCATSRRSKDPAPDSLFVHVTRRQCVGIVLRGHEVVGGFMAYDGGPVIGMAWPMTVLERVGDRRYRVECAIGVPGKMLAVDWVLEVGAVEDWSLEYSLRREHAADGEQLGGLAVSPERVRRMLDN